MSCRSKSIDSQAQYVRLFCGQAIGPVANQPSTHEWRSLCISIGRWHREAIPVVSNCIVSITPIQGIASELGIIAEIFLVLSAIAALSICISKPGNPDSLADAKSIYMLPFFHYRSNYFVTGD
jgi:hypothetical protein